MASILFKLSRGFQKHRGLLLVTLLALAVRLVWNLKIHPPLEFAYSDMAGYLDRANIVLDRPWKVGTPHPYGEGFFEQIGERLWGVPTIWMTLFPYGTHAFLTVVKFLFGRNNATAIGVAYAVIGALAVSYSYATAARFTPRRWVRRIVALILVIYYPWISLGGYALSEAPFTLCVAATAFYGLRLADEGRARDAWLLGLFAGLGFVVRPQILVAVVLIAIHFLFRARTWKRFTLGLAMRAAIPLAFLVAISSARLAWHTGEWKQWPRKAGLVSTNGPMNAVFGRCHNHTLNSEAKDGKSWFGPPSLGALWAYEKEHPKPLFRLDPVFGETVKITGHMWDAEPNQKMAAACVKKSGYLRQAKFAITHVVLLWGYNIIWPDQGQKPKWKVPMQVFCIGHAILILPGAAIAMFLAFRRRHARTMLIALHVWSQVITAMLYFGDTRYRAPYDGLLVILAIAMYPEIAAFVRRGIERLRARRAQRAPSLASA